MGRSTLEDKSGNDNAEALATAGAYMHLGSHTDRERFAVEVLVAKSVQHMMLDIVMARREKLTEESTTSSCGSDSDDSVADSGSSGSSSTTQYVRRIRRRARGRAAPFAPK